MAFNQTIGSDTETAIFQNAKCTTFHVKCLASSDNPVLIRIPGMHAADDYVRIMPGDSQYFRINHGGIRTVYAKGDTGNALVDYGVVAITSIV
jgi:hypothetical protein